MVSCLHCKTECSPPEGEGQFCCKGCEFVHGLLEESGFQRFYELKGGVAGIPVRDRPFQPVDFSWLEEQASEEEKVAGEGGTARMETHVSGISCLGCVWLIEKIFQRQKGAVSADVFPQNGTLRLRWIPGKLCIAGFARELQRFGYVLQPLGEEEIPESRGLGTRLGICGGLAMNAMAFALPRYLGMGENFMFARLFDLVVFASASFALLVSGPVFFKRAWQGLRAGELHIDLPISLGLALAWAGSLAGWTLGREDLMYFDFVATFAFLMLGGRYLHLLAVEKARRQVSRASPLPGSYEKTNGERIAPEGIKQGDSFLVESGSAVPVAAFLREETAELSLAWTNGEPNPVIFQPGRRMPAGAVNLNRKALAAEADEDWRHSFTATLMKDSARTPVSATLGKILRWYLAAVLVLGAAGGLAWAFGLFGESEPVTGLQVAISIFVVSCPCALGVAIPLADQRASLFMHRQGVFPSGTAIWERLRRTRTLLLDKTGTLTLERPVLDEAGKASLASLPGKARRVLATLAASSLHPLSRSLAEACAGEEPLPGGAQAEELPGHGLHLKYRGDEWFLGKEHTPSPSANPSCELRRGHETLARFTFRETLLPQTRKALREISRGRAIESRILSGDKPESVRSFSSQLGIPEDHVHAALSPEEKAELVKKLPPALYLGDGGNDSLAFEHALVTGTPVADRSLLDRKADFLFTSPGLGFLPRLFLVAGWRTRTVRAIVLFSIAYNLCAVAFCLAGRMEPLLAAILMPLSSLATILLAARRITA